MHFCHKASNEKGDAMPDPSDFVIQSIGWYQSLAGAPERQLNSEQRGG